MMVSIVSNIAVVSAWDEHDTAKNEEWDASIEPYLNVCKRRYLVYDVESMLWEIKLIFTSEVIMPTLIKAPSIINILPTSNSPVAKYMDFHGTGEEMGSVV